MEPVLIMVAMVVGLMVYLIVTSWRASFVIETATDDELINELKRRAYQRKLKREADSEVEAKITMNIPY